jgi:hypothetical protein
LVAQLVQVGVCWMVMHQPYRDSVRLLSRLSFSCARFNVSTSTECAENFMYALFKLLKMVGAILARSRNKIPNPVLIFYSMR